MARATSSRIGVAVVASLIAVLVIGAALLVWLWLGHNPNSGVEPAPSPQPAPSTTSTIPAATPAPTQTPSPTEPVAMPGPTLEPSPAVTSTPQSTSTPARQPTHTPSPTPTQPPKPSVYIRTFTASPDPIERSGTVTLTWDAPGAEAVGITRLSPTGDIFLEPEAHDLPAQGSMDLQVPDNYVESVKYYLGARDATGELAQAYVTVGVLCSYDEYIAPRCPLSQVHPWAAYEPFERGHMVWREDTREIYVLYDDGDYETYLDTWQEGDPVVIPGTPPPGLYAPVRGFGNLYASQPQARERLGWATAEEEGYTMWVETRPGGSGRYPGITTYFTLPDGTVLNLYPFTSTWQSLP
ncbi:MAG: hypothetical protein GWN58_46455 [Anaerolineae bacterium]|nr:hypothetical protein [Anaerolineae bacterium]